MSNLKRTQTGQDGDTTGPAATAARCSGIAGTTGRPGAGANTAGRPTGGSPLANRSNSSVIATKMMCTVA